MRCLAVNDKLKKIWKKMKKEKWGYKYSVLIVTMFVSSINYNLFLRPLKIVAGGTNGLSIIVEKLFSISPSTFILYFSIAILILGYLTVGVKKASSALVATFVYPLFVDLTEGINSYVHVSSNDIIIASIFAGAITGWVAGLTCKVDLSQGGITLINQILYEKFRISISKSNFIINFIIVLVGGYCFGITSVLCAIILLYVSSHVIDKVMLGISSHKSFYIITDREKDIKDYILKDLRSGATVFDVKSGKNDDDRSILMVAVPNDLYYKVTRKIKMIDHNAFFIVTDSYEVMGGHNS